MLPVGLKALRKTVVATLETAQATLTSLRTELFRTLWQELEALDREITG